MPRSDDMKAMPRSEIVIRGSCRELGNDSLGMTAPWKLEDGLVGGARKWVGCHVSISGGMEKAVINAAACGKSTLKS